MGENNTENAFKGENNSFTPKSEDELAKERKSRKRELIVGAIGDMGSAFANLFSTINGAPSMNTNKQATLMERIKNRHKEEEEAYSKNLSAWEKEQERKRKEAEKIREENDVIEDIHPDFRPKTKNWQQKDYIDLLYEKLRTSIRDNAEKYNEKNRKGVTRIYTDGSSSFIPSEESSVIDYMDRFHTEGNAGRYMKAELIREILSGDYKNEELSDDFLDRLRKGLSEDEENFIIYK